MSLVQKLRFLVSPEARADAQILPAGWSNSLSDALQAAQDTGKKFVLVKVHADWCSYCRKLDLDMAGDSDLAYYVRTNFACARVKENTRDGKVYRKEHKIIGFPCCLIYKSDGTFLEKIRGYPSAEAFFESLRKAVYLR